MFLVGVGAAPGGTVCTGADFLKRQGWGSLLLFFFGASFVVVCL